MFFDLIHDKLCFLCADKPRRAITYAWFSSILLVFIMFIVACVVSSNASTDSKALKFAGFWTVLLMIALVGGGTLIMRRYQTPLALGFFLGAVVVMANQCLILTAIFGEESEKNNDKAAGTFATFSFFLFCVYSIFAGMLAIFRADLVQEQDLPSVTVGGAGIKAPSVSNASNAGVPTNAVPGTTTK
ncbi:hypothetical protein TL16_g11081 [Triparma laevis f. inornata]|uniref:Uncharacterized protein n=1 Tax=Triparma laevis f. inornata TaxID=1714386 RepID=A0A9W7EQT7_9STRA|nr:hypothetical protein TL16_g11081 [Triparma laevis f. inornata]